MMVLGRAAHTTTLARGDISSHYGMTIEDETPNYETIAKIYSAINDHSLNFMTCHLKYCPGSLFRHVPAVRTG
ncbi:hypothetical protein [Actinomadura sp. DC4]|uniref:hypothetical protein n=1 Tax=Actinomadura sp. DC4 TaxID=3055069 RepID=UPI0025AF3CED|nr:hypothetical protein [Actinomadura sp. DC4]MDN3351506.1 hypothetical protein [Actinomadura sp. DC4]